MKLVNTALIAIFLVACSDRGANSSAVAVTANPHATDAAALMLERGGHAVDAAIAAHAVLGLVEPQSSGIGGGIYMLVYERRSGKAVFHDGRENAPAGARADMFMRRGKAMPFLEAWQSGLSVGVPGAIAGYKAAHREHGKLPWKDLFQPAIALAEKGFVVSPRMEKMLSERVTAMGRLAKNPDTAAYFFPGGKPLKAGDLRKNPEYAHTLRRVAEEGISAFYEGDLPKQMAKAARARPNGGTLTAKDIADYRPRRSEAICEGFRDMTICAATPPSSGAVQIMMARLYDHLVDDDSSQADKIAAFVDAQRLAYADRDHFFGDPRFVDVPLQALMAPDYLKFRAGQRFEPSATPVHGDPLAFSDRSTDAGDWGVDTTEDAAGTTHLSIVDGEGNAVAMTASVEFFFGSSRWAGGFLLNNQLTDFAFKVPADGKLPANAVAPGKRPRSSMSPTLVLNADGSIRMLSGSPGGNSIIAYVFKSLLGVLDWGLTAQQAVDFPNIIARGEKVRVETSTPEGQAIADDLKARGYHVMEREGENSGLHVIVGPPAGRRGGLEGAADFRREGAVRKVPAER